MLEEGVSNVTIVPGMQLTPYSDITTTSCCEAVEQSVQLSCIIRINPVHKRWIRQFMLDDWGILHQHKFQIRAIIDIAFHHDRITYLIAKMGSGKSANLQTIGLLQTGDWGNCCNGPSSWIEEQSG